MTAQQPEQPGLAQQADELASELRQLNASVVALRDSQRRIRQVMAWLIVGLVCVLALSLVVAGVAVQANHASAQASEATDLAAQNKRAAKIACEEGNDARDAQVSLWNYILDLSARNPRLTAEQRNQIADLREYVAVSFAHRDCDSPNPTVLPPTATPTR